MRLAAVLGLCGMAAAAAAAPLERIAAVVGERAVLASDVRAAVDLGLVPIGREAGVTTEAAAALTGAPPESADTSSPAVVAAVIERVLVLDEVERFGDAAPSDEQVDRRITMFREQLGPRLPIVLARCGLDDTSLRATVRDQLQIEAYLAERFGNAAQPTDDEVEEFARAHRDELARDGRSASPEDVLIIARERLARERRDVLVRDWIAGLKRRTDITIVQANGR